MKGERPELSEAEQGALMRRIFQMAKAAGNIMAEPTDKSEWAEWLYNADNPTRMAHPQHYWYVKPEGEPTQFFWDEKTVSRQEYLLGTGEDDVPLV